ncbi:nucleotidyltransferase family protein [Arthrobacter sp. zg-Y916]|uniref:nucleotidyltransferase family protein n=1 Tax=Arthrobacter sp. zg-Y916 TaxID=2894190 RepID=UPI001E6045E6|nr:nucleotidyltransferase family protein [Arthrobacter sp. zg-Y916]MCC9192535.1 nucleotidyltransferase family protein [Arthrobacter sp. zg-Y916]
MVSAVLLAAGSGTRLGLGPKALLPFNGAPLIEHLAGVLAGGGCSRVIVVLGAESRRVRATANLSGAHVLTNPDWETGMGSSFRAGTAEALRLAPEEPVLVALSDQPGLSVQTVARLISRGAPARVSCAGYRLENGGLKRGHPVLFAPQLARAAAAGARGDAGARTFLAAHPGLVDLVECGSEPDGLDIDTPADLILLKRPLPSSGPLPGSGSVNGPGA